MLLYLELKRRNLLRVAIAYPTLARIWISTLYGDELLEKRSSNLTRK